MKSEQKKTVAELRKFGLVMAIPLGIITGLFFWKGRGSAVIFLALTLFFASSALVFPKILTPVERYWMKLAEILSAVMTRVILTLTFFIVITPLGLFLRLIGKDLLQRKFEPDRPSYWEPVEPDGPCSRPDKPF